MDPEEALQRTLQALALPPQQQIAYLANYTEGMDQVALDFGHWRDLLLQSPSIVMSGDQLAALDAVDDILIEMLSGSSHGIWSTGALRSRLEWQQLRAAARAALAAFGWPLAPPDA